MVDAELLKLEVVVGQGVNVIAESGRMVSEVIEEAVAESQTHQVELAKASLPSITLMKRENCFGKLSLMFKFVSILY